MEYSLEFNHNDTVYSQVRIVPERSTTYLVACLHYDDIGKVALLRNTAYRVQVTRAYPGDDIREILARGEITIKGVPSESSSMYAVETASVGFKLRTEQTCEFIDDVVVVMKVESC